MSSGQSQRKLFDEEQQTMIRNLRDEGKSVDTVAAILMVGKERVRRFCKENNLGVYQNTKNPRCNIGQPRMPMTIEEYPDFANALCKNETTDRFFPGAPPQGRLARQKYSEALKIVINICKSCPIQEMCLEYAIKAEPYGIWGGTTEIEREYLRAKLQIECQRDITLTRIGRKARLGFMSPALAPSYDMQFGSSPLIKKRLSQVV